MSETHQPAHSNTAPFSLDPALPPPPPPTPPPPYANGCNKPMVMFVIIVRARDAI